MNKVTMETELIEPLLQPEIESSEILRTEDYAESLNYERILVDDHKIDKDSLSSQTEMENDKCNEDLKKISSIKKENDFHNFREDFSSTGISIYIKEEPCFDSIDEYDEEINSTNTGTSNKRKLNSERTEDLEFINSGSDKMCSRTNFFLVTVKSEITGSRLPSGEDVLSLLLHHHMDQKLPLRQSSTLVSAAVKKFWDKARIPTIRNDSIIDRIDNLYKKYQALKKGRTRRSDPQICKEKQFLDQIKDLFDVAHHNAMEMIRFEEDQEFLKAQRESGRMGYMGSVDKSLAAQEKCVEARSAKEAQRKTHAEIEALTSSAMVVLESSSSSNEDNSTSEKPTLEESQGACGGASLPKQTQRARKNVITREVAAVFDRTGLTDRKATMVATVLAKTLGEDARQLNINRST